MGSIRTRRRFTRPADTTQYTANDLVSNDTDAADSTSYLQFDLGALRGGTSGRIIGGSLRKSTTTATVATFALHLFDRVKTPSQGDNGASVHFGDGDGYIGSLTFDMTSANVAVFNGPIYKPSAAPASPLCFAGAASIYGYLVATGAYAPGNAEIFEVALDIET